MVVHGMVGHVGMLLEAVWKFRSGSCVSHGTEAQTKLSLAGLTRLPGLASMSSDGTPSWLESSCLFRILSNIEHSEFHRQCRHSNSPRCGHNFRTGEHPATQSSCRPLGPGLCFFRVGSNRCCQSPKHTKSRGGRPPCKVEGYETFCCCE